MAAALAVVVSPTGQAQQFAQTPLSVQAPPAPAVPADPATKPLSPRETYAAMTHAERTAIQSDLVWTGHYAGIIDGDFGNRSLAAVQAFQKAAKHTETGILNPRERARLSAQARARQEEVGWRRIDDSTTGVSMGMPTKLAPQASRGKDGARWTSKDGAIEIETFRISGPATTLAGVTAQLRAVAGRKIDYDVQRPGFFVLIGTQSGKKFYIRAHAQDREVRGFTVRYEADKDAMMQPITVAISNAFAPFSGRGTIQLGGAAARRKVEYTSGIVVSAAGYILADRQATEGCKTITTLPLGPAERAGDDPASGLALLRIYGAAGLRPATLAGDARGDNDVTLVGIADPRMQAGSGAITTLSARLSDTDHTLDPVPPPGFSGAAAIDRRGRFRGVVLHKPAVVANQGANGTGTQAVLVLADDVQKFLRKRDVRPLPGPTAVNRIRAAVVRVICVRS